MEENKLSEDESLNEKVAQFEKFKLRRSALIKKYGYEFAERLNEFTPQLERREYERLKAQKLLNSVKSKLNPEEDEDTMIEAKKNLCRYVYFHALTQSSFAGESETHPFGSEEMDELDTPEHTFENVLNQLEEEFKEKWRREALAVKEEWIRVMKDPRFDLDDVANEYYTISGTVVDEALRIKEGDGIFNQPQDVLETKRKEMTNHLLENVVLFHVIRKSTPFGGSPQDPLGSVAFTALDLPNDFIRQLVHKIWVKLDQKYSMSGK